MSDRLKFRVWDKDRKCFFNDDEVVIYPNGEESFFNADYDFAETVVNQCSGLKDKNGKLIYENDYVKIKDTVYKVFWNKTKISLENILKKDIIDVDITQNMEVVGNVHEARDSKKV